MILFSECLMGNSSQTLLIGPLPKRPEGLSIAFEVVVSGFINRRLAHKVINTQSEDVSRQVGTFSFKRAMEIAGVLLRYWWNLLPSRQIYLLIGFSRVSFFRDFLIIWPAYWLWRRIVLHVHTGGYRTFFDEQPIWLKKIISATLMRADAIVVLGELLREQFNFLSCAEEKLVVVPNCAPIEVTEVSAKPKKYNKAEPIKILYMSNLIESKGYLDCLEACRILHHERKVPVSMFFCGGVIPHRLGSGDKQAKELLDYFLNQIHRMDLVGIAEYCGVVNGDKKYKYLCESHVFILPTYYPWEGQPVSIIEALSFGIPVIATRFRGIPEQVIDNYNGFLVEPHNPVEIADRVEVLVTEPNLYSLMSANAIQHFKQNFTRQRHLSSMIPIILGD